MIIYNDYIIITPNKCGTHSIEEFFMKNAKYSRDGVYINFPPYYDSGPIPINKGRHSVITPEGLEKQKKILIIRNPYERFVSIIEFIILRDNKERTDDIYDDETRYIAQVRKKFKNNMMDSMYDNYNEVIGEERIIELYKGDLVKNKSEIETVEKQRDMVWYRTIGEVYNLSKPDYAVKLENFKDDIRKITNLDTSDFPHNNKNPQRKSLKEFFNNQEKIDIANTYFDCAKDAVRFGYKPILTLKDLYDDGGLLT
jgi:hypothetical protein